MGAEHLDTGLRSGSELESGNVEERMQLRGQLRGSRGDDGFVEVEEVSLRDGQLVVQDVKEFPLHPSNVPHSKNASGSGPADISQRRIVGILQEKPD